jgi:DNA mismatch endonuclease (patch repair protein)
MKAVRLRESLPELRVQAACRSLGYRFRRNVDSLPGRPDLANSTRRFAVLVHGCFWHRHPGCTRATTPKHNAAFWRDKFEANMRRDKRNVIALKRLGFRVVVIWECQTRDPGSLRTLLSRRLKGL